MDSTLKRALTISAFINILLAILAIYFVRRTSVTNIERRSTSSFVNSPNDTPTPANAGFTLPQLTSKPFDWNQLESTNYRVYVSNLRAIGCPEQTIRDIITADAHTLYAPKFEELERKKSSLVSDRLSDQLAAQRVEAELQTVRNEEASVIAAALESQIARVAAPSRTLRQTISVPLVLQEVDPTVLKLDQRQREVIAELRQRFEQEIGPNRDPDDPAYRDRWRTAQRNSDDMLAGMLGGQFFVEYQLHAGKPPQTQ